MAKPVAQQEIDRIKPPFTSADLSLISKVEERNRQVEDNPEWIEASYEGLKLRKLTNVSEKEYEHYRQFVKDETVYIAVHPAYFPFIQYKPLTSTGEESYKQNVIERFLSVPPADIEFSVLQAQERRTRDFLEFTSTDKKLMILILPKNYQEFGGYTYKKGPDEYTRYLNEVTNLSESVVYIESKTANRGYLKESDMVRLLEFLMNVGAKKVLMGGGYVGRCLEDFYIDFSSAYGTDDVFVVPELSDVSPKELSRALAKSLMMPDGTINKDVATQNMHTDAYGSQEVRPNLRNLP